MSALPTTDPAAPRPDRRAWRGGLANILPALLLSAGATAAAEFAAGPTLGAVFGGLFAATLILPPLAAGHAGRIDRLIISLAVTAGTAAVWLMLISPARATAGQWLAMSAMLLSYCLALTCLAAALEHLKLLPLIASAATVIAGLGWMTWPVWLSPWMTRSISTQMIARLVAIHPPLVANGVLTFTSPWTEQTIAYGLTALGQDIAIALPARATACIAVHLLAALAFFGVTLIRRKGVTPISMTPSHL